MLPTRWFLTLLVVVVLATGFQAARSRHPGDGPDSEAFRYSTASSGADGGQRPAVRPVDPTGQPAPDFSLPDLRGVRRTLSEQRGKVMMLIFWDSGCKACLRELSPLSTIARALAPHGLVTLSLNRESDPGPADQQGRSLPFPVLRDLDGQTFRDYEAYTIPRVVIVNRSGRIARVIRGYPGDVAPVVRALAQQGLAVPSPALQELRGSGG